MQITGYIRSILLFMIFITFIGIIIPHGKYKKYIDMVTGLVLLMIVVQPMTGLLNGDPIPVNKVFSGLADLEESPRYQDGEPDYENMQYEILKKTYDELAVKQMQNILDKEGAYTIISAEIETSEDFGQIKSIVMRVDETDAAPSSKPLIWIDPVRIGSDEDSDNDEDSDIKKLKNTLSEFYNLSPNNIHITVRKKTKTGDERP